MSETTTTIPPTITTITTPSPPATTTTTEPPDTTTEPSTTTEPPTTTPPTTTPPTTTPPTTSEEETETSETETETETSETETTTSEPTTTPPETPTTETTTGPPTTQTSQVLTSISTGNGVTETVIVTPPDTGPTQSAIADNSSGGSSFFDNKGAVAGVFTVVGLAALVLIIVIATNAIRRRRAKKFDDEVAAAAAEANASPRYPFDDYDDPAPGRGAGGGGYGSYSDPESHGTMSQVPLTHHGESYNMNEFNGGYGPSYGASATAVGAGAAGIGTLARRNTNTHGDIGSGTPGVAGYGATQNAAYPVAPYNAFAGPINTMPTDPYDPYTAGNLGIKRQPSRGAADLLDAAGIGATAAGGAAAGAVAAGALNRGHSQSTAEQLLDRQRSSATQRTLSPDNSNHSGKTQESYAAHYQPDFRPDEHQYQPAGASGPQPSGSSGEALPNPFARDGTDEDAYGVDSFSPAGRHSPALDDGRMSIRDEEDYGRAGRTLKVANE